MNVRLGSILLWPKAGVLAHVLSFLIRFLDPDKWVRSHYWYWGKWWHMSFVCGQTMTGEWIVRNVSGEITYPLLCDLPKTYAVVNYLDPQPQCRIDTFLDNYDCESYDRDGYFWAAINRLSKGRHPKVVDHDLYCWEDVSNFCDWCHKPFMKWNEMAWMPQFLKEYVNS